MAKQGGSIQSTVKAVCSISYVSEKLQVSRPSLYKYMDLYDAGERAKIPLKVLRFFDYLSFGTRTEDDAILYFIKARNEDEADGPSEILAECITGGGCVMVLFPDAEKPEDVVVEVLVDTSGGLKVIGEYRPEPGRRFVRIDDLVPGHLFYYRKKMADGRSAGEPVPFLIGGNVRGISVGVRKPAILDKGGCQAGPPLQLITTSFASFPPHQQFSMWLRAISTEDSAVTWRDQIF